MARKVKCENTECKHHCKNDYCDTMVKINSSGRCESFEKNIVYYIRLVWEVLSDKNFIDMVEIARNPEIRIGLFNVDCVADNDVVFLSDGRYKQIIRTRKQRR